MDQSRQWPKSLADISTHHLQRYELATKYASGRILDAACGVGYGAQLLSTGGKEVVGVDASQEALNWASRFFRGPTYICGRIEERPWEGKFDTVVSLETIEHLQDPTEALKAFRDCCTGEFIASVPNEEAYPFNAHNFRNDDSPHFRHYTPKEFEELLEKHGFKVTERFCQVSKGEPWVVAGTNGKFLIYICT